MRTQLCLFNIRVFLFCRTYDIKHLSHNRQEPFSVYILLCARCFFEHVPSTDSQRLATQPMRDVMRPRLNKSDEYLRPILVWSYRSVRVHSDPFVNICRIGVWWSHCRRSQRRLPNRWPVASGGRRWSRRGQVKLAEPGVGERQISVHFR